MPRHDRRGSLAECAGLHIVGESRHHVAVKLHVDRHGRAAELGPGRRGRIGLGQPPETRNIGREFENASAVNLVQHNGL